jgi:hypothetical protein
MLFFSGTVRGDGGICGRAETEIWKQKEKSKAINMQNSWLLEDCKKIYVLHVTTL